MYVVFCLIMGADYRHAAVSHSSRYDHLYKLVAHTYRTEKMMRDLTHMCRVSFCKNKKPCDVFL